MPDVADSDWRYCGPGPHGANSTSALAPPGLSPAWLNDGFSPCFLHTTALGLQVFLALVVGGLAGCCIRSGRRSADSASPTPSSRHFQLQQWLSILVAVVWLAHLTAITSIERRASEYIVVWDLLAAMAWSFSIAQLRKRHKSSASLPGLPIALFWASAALHLALEAASANSPHWFFQRLHEPDAEVRHRAQAELVLFAVRSGAVAVLLLSSLFLALARRARHRGSYTLLESNDDGNGDSTPASASASSSINTPDKVAQPQGTVRHRSGAVFSKFMQTVKKVWPFVWPVGDCPLQMRVVLCFLLLGAGRAVNLIVPLYYKKVVDKLTAPSSPSLFDIGASPHVPFPAVTIIIYVLLRLLQGGGSSGMGILNNARSFLWIKVQQWTSKKIQVTLFAHLHELSLRWHLSRKTGEVLRIVDRGSSSVNSLLSAVLFSVAPTLVDIAIAVVYFTIAFGSYFGLIVFATMAGYIAVTVILTEWRTKFRRGMNKHDNELRQKAVDSLLNAETVKLFNSADIEVEQYNNKIDTYQLDEWKSLSSLTVLNMAQSIVITLGLAAGCLLCGYLVSIGELTVGDFVMYIAYVQQLYQPLNYFGTYYRMIVNYFVDMENMLDLLDVEPEVRDIPNAPQLPLAPSGAGCTIEFDNVVFGYEPRKTILKGISFSVPAGQSLAIVGPTGSGKSTIMRLLFRFYDVSGGSIRVNGADISRVSRRSLRRFLGVVPQDTVLFHTTVRDNIKYGSPGATDEDVFEAARGAEIHDQICTFPDGYDTVVGERGLKLSGGEKQRVAIARIIIKNPPIVMLDEATSALDTTTEKAIQASLDRICVNRTTLIIAHRLSTVVHANQILVLSDGEIVERGNHSDLLRAGGVYASMWQQQLDANEEQSALPAGDGAAPKGSAGEKRLAFSSPAK